MRHPQTLSEAARTARVLAGIIVGLAVGLVVDVGLLLAAEPGADLFAHVRTLHRDRLVFLVGGAALGTLAGAEWAGLFSLLRASRYALGALVGAGCGLVLYAIGYVTATHPSPPSSPVYLVYYWEALHSFTLFEAGSALVGSAVGYLTVRYSWRLYGVLAYVALISVVVGYFLYALMVTLPQVPARGLPLSLVLLAAEGASLALVVIYSFYALDIFVRKRWRRGPDQVTFSKYYLPKVAFHLACFNEPLDILKETLEALMRLDYPKDRYVIMVLDDSTDEDLRRPLEAYCREHGIMYVHRTDRSGYKAGALNNALKVTPKDVELISVIDADYQVEPEYLRETVGFFINPNLGFVQAPQDYRNVHQSFLTEQYYYADSYFYRAVMPSRNEENTIIFCGTMGLMRRATLEEVGGWGEEHITEDAELSVRVLEAGWDSLYVPKTFGRGLIPSTFEAYKKQHYRWAFGGSKILRTHLRRFLFSPLSLRQKFDFLMGSFHWLDGIFLVAIAAVVGLLGAAEALGMPLATYHQREIWLIGLVPIFLLLDGLIRLYVAMKRSMNLSLAGTLRVMGMWYAIKFTHMFAAWKSMLGAKMPFVRTPKAPSDRPGRLTALVRSLRLARFEAFMSLSLVTVAGGVFYRAYEHFQTWGQWVVPQVLLGVWALYYAVVFSAAPLYAYKAYVTFTPDQDLWVPRPRPVRGG